jgi:hypothetical protein
MPVFFPRHTIDWHAYENELRLVRRVSLSLVGVAAFTGVVVHLYRWVILTYGSLDRWWFLLAGFGGGVLILLGMATAHLANHPIRQWVWRAPLFAVVESATEAVMSAILITLGVERLGTEKAHWHDWPSLAFEILLVRTLIIATFSLVLGVVVQWVRFALLRHEHRDHTALAIHEDHLRHHE